MAVTINTGGTYKVVRVSNADSLTNWALIKIEGSGGTPSVFASVGTIDLVKEGTDAVASVVNKQRINIYYQSGSYDFTPASSGGGATKVPSGIVYIWNAFLAAGSALIKANGGGQISLSDGTNTSYWNVYGSDTYSGGFIKWAILTTITPSENSGANANLGNITRIGFVNDVGATTTRFDNMVVDAMDVGNGLTFQGTTTTNKLFLESQAIDNATKIGVLENYSGEIFSQGNLLFSGTSMISNAETLVFKDTLGGAYTYTLSITGTVTLTNSAVKTSGVVNFNFNTASATAFTMNGGSIAGFNILTTGSGQTVNGAVFQAGGSSTIANTITNSSFNICGLITVNGALTGCAINNGTASASVITSDLAKVTDCNFVSDGSNHAVELTSIGGGSMSWNNTLTGYVSGGSGGSPVTPTSTGNEAIFVNVGSGTFTINVAAGATTPSIRSAGATVNVVAGLKTFTFNTLPAFVGYEWRIYSVTAIGSLAGSVELAGEEVSTLSTHAYSYSYTVDTPIAVQVLAQPGADYIEEVRYYTLIDGDQSTTINLTIDINN